MLNIAYAKEFNKIFQLRIDKIRELLIQGIQVLMQLLIWTRSKSLAKYL